MPTHLPFPPMEIGYFRQRVNRFVAEVDLNNKMVTAHVPTSGRLKELLLPGAELLLEPANSAQRRTPFSLRAVRQGQIWVAIDAKLPNRLMKQVLSAQALPPLADCVFVRGEPVYSGGRFDFLLAEGERAVYVEVKSVTLVEGDVAFFPDAPTARGRRHLDHLADLHRAGCRCAVLFVVQRPDADYFAPNQQTDLPFAQALRQALTAGVEVYAYRCRVSRDGLTLAERLPVLL